MVHVYPTALRERALALLVQEDLTLSEVSRRLGVSRAAIRDWRDNGTASVIGGECPERPSNPAYAALFGFYLGDGCISRMGRTQALRVSCDRKYPGIISDVSTLMNTINPARPVHLTRPPGAVVVQSYWKHWPCLFPQHGPGRKHERELGMQEWQWEVVCDHPADFLRGLFHSDGARVRNWATRMVAGEKRRYEYPRWQFSNRSEEILGWCGDALDLVEVSWRRSHVWMISVSRRSDVQRLDELVGPKA